MTVLANSTFAEQSVLAGLLHQNESLGSIEKVLAAEDFGDAENAKIFASIKRVVNAGGAADTVTVEAEGHDIKYLTSLTLAESSAKNIVHHARIVKRCSEARAQPVRAFDHAVARRRAGELLAPAAPPDREYPVEALGVLSPACRAIAEEGQLQLAMAGQCLLGAASLLLQGLYNVQTINGAKPLSLYLMTLSPSGTGKSTAQGVALHAVHEWQRQRSKKYSDDQKAFKLERSKKGTGDAGPAAPPDNPFRLVNDPTVEGLRRDLDEGPCSQGVFTDEAAAILSGYGMSAEQRAKTAGVYSKLWDSGHLSSSRATTGRIERYGRRLAAHWLIQPIAASETLHDKLLAQLGFWPRFLFASLPSGAPRRAKAFQPEKHEAITTYWARCDALLAIKLFDDAGNCKVITLQPDAEEMLCAAFEKYDQLGKVGVMRSIEPFALRAAEQVCRVAGVLAAFDEREVVSVDDMCGAIKLVNYSLDSWMEVFEKGAGDEAPHDALRLYEWLLTRPNLQATTTDILKNAVPHALRRACVRDASIDLLVAHDLITVTGRIVRVVLTTTD